MNHRLETTRSEDRLSQSLSSASEMSQLLRMRKKRRLPPVLEHRKSLHLHKFWPTYRGAVEWLRKRQNDLNIALGLLEIYPNLIQESPLDGLWEFIRPLVPQTSKDEGVAKKNGFMSSSKAGFANKERKSTSTQIPTISITGVSGGDKDISSSVDCKLVYVCGMHDRRRIRTSQARSLVNVVVEELSRVVYTRVSPCSQGNVTDKNVSGIISESNAFIFILSEDTISDQFCANQLRLASLCCIPIVYVKQPGFTLPNPLPDFLFEKTWDLDTGYGSRSFAPSRARSVSPAVIDTMELRKHDNRIPRPPLVTNGSQASSERLKKKRSNDKSNNTAMQLIDGCRTSLIYGEDFHGSFVKELYEKLSLILGISFPQATDTLHPLRRSSPKPISQKANVSFGATQSLSVHLRVTSPDSEYREKEEKDEDGKDDGSYDEGLGHVFVDNLENNGWIIPEIDSGISSPLEKETMYIIYPSPQPGGPPSEGPKVVKWPPKPGEGEGELEGDSYENFYPLIDSPFGFEDVNLTTTVDSGSDSFGDI